MKYTVLQVEGKSRRKFLINANFTVQIVCLFLLDAFRKILTFFWRMTVNVTLTYGTYLKNPVCDPLVLNQFYCCPHCLALPSFPYSPIKATVQPCFIVMLIDWRPSGDVAKDNGEAKKIQHFQLLLRAWLCLSKM